MSAAQVICLHLCCFKFTFPNIIVPSYKERIFWGVFKYRECENIYACSKNYQFFNICNKTNNLSRKPQYKDVYSRTIEMLDLQRARTFKVNCCLKVHNPHQKLLSPILGYEIIDKEKRSDTQKLRIFLTKQVSLQIFPHLNLVICLIWYWSQGKKA